MGSQEGNGQSGQAWDLFPGSPNRFSDEGALLLDDPEPVAGEGRFVLLGLSAKLRVLVVIHCYRKAEQVIRIISARKADRLERQQYVTRNA